MLAILLWLMVVGTEDEPQTMESVLVVGKRGAVSTTTTRLDKEAMKSAGGGSIAEALSGVPGLELNSDPKSGSLPFLRGFDERRSLFLVDGVPVKEVYAGYYDLSSIAASRTSVVEVERGVTSVLYGPGALGGIIRVFTRRPAPGAAFSGQAWGGGFEHSLPGDTGGDVFAGYGGRRLDLSLSGVFQHSDGYPVSADFKPTASNAAYHEDGGMREGSGYDRGGVTGRAGYRFSDSVSAVLVSNYFNQRRTIPPWEGAGYIRYWDYTRYSTLASSLSLSFRSPGSAAGLAGLDLTIWMQNHSDEIIDRGNAAYAGITDNSLAWFAASAFDNRSLGGQLLPSFVLWKKNRLECALLATEDVHVQNEVRPANSAAMIWSGEEESRARTVTLAAEDSQEMGPLKLLAGVGYSRLFMADEIFRGKTYEGTGGSKEAVDGRVVARLALPAGLSLIASGGRKTRFPNLKELYSNSVGGSPGLKAEYAWMGEVGLDWNRPVPLVETLGFRGFWSDVREMIDQQPGKPYANLARARLFGTESWLTAGFGRRVRSTFSHTWTRAVDQASGRELPFRTRHLLSLLLSARNDAGTSAWVKGVYRSGQPAWIYSLASSQNLIRELPESFVLDVYLRQELLKGRPGFHAFAQVRNVFDENLSVGSFDPMPGRTWMVGLGGDY